MSLSLRVNVFDIEILLVEKTGHDISMVMAKVTSAHRNYIILIIINHVNCISPGALYRFNSTIIFTVNKWFKTCGNPLSFFYLTIAIYPAKSLLSFFRLIT